ncbi:MAG: EI24 domain-containing protein [Bdellovibrionia bacterium]
MAAVLKAMSMAFRDLLHPKIALVFVLPALVSLFLWILIYLFFVSAWIAWLAQSMVSFEWVLWLQEILTFDFTPVSQIIALVASVLLFLPATYLTTVILVSFFAMPVIVPFVHTKYYSSLEKNKSQVIKGILNTLKHSFIFVCLLMLSLPLWLIPGMQILIPIFLTAALNRRVFTFDALSDFKTAAEIYEIQSQHRKEFYGLGLLLGLFSYIPFLSFFVPVWGALAYSHLSLDLARSSVKT